MKQFTRSAIGIIWKIQNYNEWYKAPCSSIQDRVWRALKKRYQYDSSLKDSQGFLLNNVNSKISLVIMYADLVGSTIMNMTLPVD